jgi:hypothetical protein
MPRLPPLALLCLLACTSTPALPVTVPKCGPLDDTLRLNQIQVLGTHNSYHVARTDPLDPSLAYTHPPLDVQLATQGARHFELDLHKAAGQPFQVFHIPGIDPLSNCKQLQDCLGTLRQWSDAHPCHPPLYVLFEPKDELDADKLAGQWDALEAELLAAFPRERIVTPDDVRAKHATLRDMVQAHDWPTLGATRGKVLFVLMDKTVDDVAYGEDYRKGHAKYAGRLMFVFGEPSDPDIAFVKRDNPSDEAEVGGLVKAGYLVRGTAEGDVGPGLGGASDQARRAHTLATVHLVTTDWPQGAPGPNGWEVALPGGTSSRCHPLTAPVGCTATAIESAH